MKKTVILSLLMVSFMNLASSQIAYDGVERIVSDYLENTIHKRYSGGVTITDHYAKNNALYVEGTFRYQIRSSIMNVALNTVTRKYKAKISEVLDAYQVKELCYEYIDYDLVDERRFCKCSTGEYVGTEHELYVLN